MRHVESIMEFLFACTITFLLYPIWYLARSHIDGVPNPQTIGPVNIMKDMMIYFYNPVIRSKLVLLPKCDTWNTLTFFMKMFLNTTDISIVDTPEQMKDVIYSADCNALGIHWINAHQTDNHTSPQFAIYKQTLYGDIDEAALNFLLLGIFELDKTVPSNFSFIDRQPYAQPAYDELYDIQILVAFFAVVPMILATMPCLQNILEEKDNHVMTLSYLMGCTETQYWLVQNIVMFIYGIIPNLIFILMMCFWYAMVGTDFTLFLVITIIYTISYNMFLEFIMTFLKGSSSGRAMTVAFAILTIFFGYLHYFYTMNENNQREWLKHLLSVVPLSAYQLVVLEFFVRIKDGYPGVGWGDILEKYDYPIWYGFVWLIADAVIYFILFLIFNATLSRDFGVQVISFKEFLNPNAWKYIFSKSNSVVDVSEIYQSENALEIEHLTKVYHGKKPVTAVDNVSFTIKQGEVIVMIGPNGAGKSTIINTVTAAIRKTSGSMKLFNFPQTEQFRNIHSYLGVCFQDNVLVPLLNVREHFFLFGGFRGIPEDEIESAIDFFANTLQLTGSLATRAIDLSGGQKRKLCLALSLLGNPPIVIMDEPTAGVDVQARQLIWKTIASLRNSTCLITSHALEEAEAVSSRLFIVSEGKLPYSGTSTELRQRFKCGYMLRVERSDGKVGPVLDFIKQMEPDAHVTEERQDTIALPVSRDVPKILKELVKNQEELGIISYSFAVEQLEDTLLKMIESAEAKIEINY